MYDGVRWCRVYVDVRCCMVVYGGVYNPLPSSGRPLGPRSSVTPAQETDDNLVVGKNISKVLTIPPKEELFRLLRVKGHTPFQRSLRPGNIVVKCSVCLGECRASTYRRDAWQISIASDTLTRQCSLLSSVSDGFVSSDTGKSGKRRLDSVRDGLSSAAGEAKKAPRTAADQFIADQFTQTDPILAGTCVLCQSLMLPLNSCLRNDNEL